MKEKATTGKIKMPKTKEQWQTYQQIGKMVKGMNRLPDLGEIGKGKARSAPLELLRAIF
jgi:hypothetical protein